jgi:hypothetical protein
MVANNSFITLPSDTILAHRSLVGRNAFTRLADGSKAFDVNALITSIGAALGSSAPFVSAFFGRNNDNNSGTPGNVNITVPGSNVEKDKEKSGPNIALIVGISAVVLVLIIVLFLVFTRKK